MGPAKLSAHKLRELSVVLSSDPRTIAKVIRREHVGEMTRLRITKGLIDLGYGHLLDDATEERRAG